MPREGNRTRQGTLARLSDTGLLNDDFGAGDQVVKAAAILAEDEEHVDDRDEGAEYRDQRHDRDGQMAAEK